MIEKLIENWLINVHELGYTIPFCEVLISRGYTIVRISRQGRGELGKDVIARSPSGELHTFQLKGPRDITLGEWQTIQNEVRDLVQLPAIDPAINREEPHVPFLVTNGEIVGDALALILIHLVVSMLHGWAHQAAMVKLTTFGHVYVTIVITIGPLVAAGFLLARKRKRGALLLALSMFGSFIFGFWYHFLSNTSDNVMQVHGPWHPTFLWTAIALAVIALAGTIVGLRLLRVTSELARLRIEQPTRYRVVVPTSFRGEESRDLESGEAGLISGNGLKVNHTKTPSGLSRSEFSWSGGYCRRPR